MRNKKIFLILVLFATFVVYGNWGGGGTSGSVGTGTLSELDIFSAIGTEKVEMQSEDLTITLHRGEVSVRVEYLLKNTGDTVHVRAGFPFLQYGKCDDPDNHNDIYEYRLMENGREIQYSDQKKVVCPEQENEPDGPEDGIPCQCVHWYISDMLFAPKEEKRVQIQYRALYSQSYAGGVGDTDFRGHSYRYILHTGAVWKGPIQKGVIKIVPFSIEPNQVSLPKQFQWDSNQKAYIWKFQNYEPEGDISIDIKDSYLASDNTNNWFIQADKKFLMFKDFKKASATSYLQNKDEYSPEVLTEKVNGTAWVEGKKGSGIDESITIELTEPTKVNEIGFTPGFYKEQDADFLKRRGLYFANNRVADAQIVINGKHVYSKHFFDEFIPLHEDTRQRYQWLKVDDLNEDVKTIQVIIKKVYKGLKYDDTAISDIILLKYLPDDFEMPRAR